MAVVLNKITRKIEKEILKIWADGLLAINRRNSSSPGFSNKSGHDSGASPVIQKDK